MTETQDLFDLFESPRCSTCGLKIAPHTDAWHAPEPWRGLGPACRPMVSAGETALIWLADLGQFYRCRDGELIRDRRDSKIATVEHFVAKARTAWRVRITAFDAFLNAYARHVGALDYLTGDAYEVTASIARPDATGWRSEPWGALA